MAEMFAPVPPPLADAPAIARVANDQARAILGGYCCRRCAVGICEDGEGLCIRCEIDADDRDRIVADCAEFRAEIRGGLR